MVTLGLVEDGEHKK